MENTNIKATESFIKELLEVYSKYMLLGLPKLDMIGIMLNTLVGLYMTMASELEWEEDDDETIH
jgi:hypothetical protein|tara:strand:- start:1192 stop:1383 length:192 start_codon:yes stop_codon:yes gene_type:complete